MAHQDFACVRCRSEAIQAVTGIISSGSWSSTTAGAMAMFEGDGGMGLGVAGFQSWGASGLAQALSPPAAPELSFMTTFFTVVTTIFMMAIALIIEIPALLWPVGLLGLAGTVTVMVTQRRIHRRDLAVWTSKVARWQNLFYCARCSSVSDLTTNQWVPAHETLRFWT